MELNEKYKRIKEECLLIKSNNPQFIAKLILKQPYCKYSWIGTSFYRWSIIPSGF